MATRTKQAMTTCSGRLCTSAVHKVSAARPAGTHRKRPADGPGRRALLLGGGLVASTLSLGVVGPESSRFVALADEEPDFQICFQDEDCASALSGADVVTTGTGLKYKDLKVGDGELPPTGYQVLANYVVMLPKGTVVDSTIERGNAADIRVGTGAVFAGLDEGLRSMHSGGLRRLYVPGDLSVQKRLAAAPGRPAVPANATLIVDVQLLYIPGVD